MKDTCIVEWKCTLTRNDCKLARWSPCEDGGKELVSVVDLEKSLIFCQSLLNASKFRRRSLVMDVPLFHRSIRCHYACRSPPSNSRVRWGKCFKMGKKVEMELSSTSTQLLPYVYMNFRFYRVIGSIVLTVCRLQADWIPVTITVNHNVSLDEIHIVRLRNNLYNWLTLRTFLEDYLTVLDFSLCHSVTATVPVVHLYPWIKWYPDLWLFSCFHRRAKQKKNTRCRLCTYHICASNHGVHIESRCPYWVQFLSVLTCPWTNHAHWNSHKTIFNSCTTSSCSMSVDDYIASQLNFVDSSELAIGSHLHRECNIKWHWWWSSYF